jgi:hypothetical protein
VHHDYKSHRYWPIFRGYQFQIFSTLFSTTVGSSAVCKISPCSITAFYTDGAQENVKIINGYWESLINWWNESLAIRLEAFSYSEISRGVTAYLVHEVLSQCSGLNSKAQNIQEYTAACFAKIIYKQLSLAVLIYMVQLSPIQYLRQFILPHHSVLSVTN